MTKLTLIAVGAALLVLLAAGTFLRGGGGSVVNLSLESLSGAQLAANDDILLVDIRTPQEWEQTGVIDGALLVTYAGADNFLAAIGPHLREGQKIALVCRTGNRSSRAARQIAAQTEAPVIDVAGGMVRIMREGYTPVAPQAATR